MILKMAYSWSKSRTYAWVKRKLIKLSSIIINSYKTKSSFGRYNYLYVEEEILYNKWTALCIGTGLWGYDYMPLFTRHDNK